VHAGAKTERLTISLRIHRAHFRFAIYYLCPPPTPLAFFSSRLVCSFLFSGACNHRTYRVRIAARRKEEGNHFIMGSLLRIASRCALVEASEMREDERKCS
jgi:hypothetical protein